MGQDRCGDGGQATRTHRGQGGWEPEADAEKQEVCAKAGSEEDSLGGSPTHIRRYYSTKAKTREDEAAHSDATHEDLL